MVGGCAVSPEAASERFGQLIENLREVVFLTDLHGNWTFLNPAWSETLGHPVAESIGTAYIDDVHPDDMPSGGVLTVRTENRPGDRVALAVSDTGIGIPPEVAERIFEPFFSTKPAGQGTGLGLSLAYSFARQSGGDISVTSHPGGTTFTLEFPRAHRAAAPSATMLPADPPNGQGELILVVDDEGILRELARAQLESAGYQVVTAADGPSALARLAEQPGIRLVFSDVLMPGGLTGVELAAQVRAQFPHSRVLLTSGFTAPGRGASFDGLVLHKPYTRGDLIGEDRRGSDPRRSALTGAYLRLIGEGQTLADQRSASTGSMRAARSAG
jgi:CheY-like chemotaxis protein